MPILRWTRCRTYNFYSHFSVTKFIFHIAQMQNLSSDLIKILAKGAFSDRYMNDFGLTSRINMGSVQNSTSP